MQPNNKISSSDRNDTTKELTFQTWNIQSLGTSVKQHALAAHLLAEQPNVMVITETWLKGTCPTLHQDYRKFSRRLAAPKEC